ncbi:SDR family oxidoreductase [Microvirga sp. BSC39]|uniref:SDR family oxidoreductase n=1 Tax=Microvirga sp. BSC39 TaxID=1549810 RepID=UPI000A47F4E0|nr:SDR family oxidoreductase [Microvirga sp. BSC39]
MKPLHQQVIVITGASSGIGLVTARMAARAGAGVLLVSRNEDALRRIAEELQADGARVDYVAADVSRREDHERIVRAAIDRFGGFDSWVNNASVGTAGELDKVTLEDHRRVFEVNYWGVVYGSLEAAKHLRRRGGAIINIGSVLGERTVVLQGPYCATKHAVRAFTTGLRMELEREGAPVSITHIKPSSIDTPFPEHARNYLRTGIQVPPPIYSPTLVAKAILFACQTPRRVLTVGFGGKMATLMGRLFPRFTDRLMEAVGYWAQETQKPGVPARRDNLYSPREDGTERSSLGYPVVLKNSPYLQAQMYPVATAAILSGLALGLAAASRARR